MKKSIILIMGLLFIFSSSCLAWTRFVVMEPFNIDEVVENINNNNTFAGDLKITNVKKNINGEYECALSDNKSILVLQPHNNSLISIGLFADENNYQPPINTLYSLFDRANIGTREDFWKALNKSYETKKGQSFAVINTGINTLYWSVESKNYKNYLFVGITCWSSD